MNRTADLEMVKDHELVARALRGEEKAYEALVCRHWEGVVRVVYRICGDLQMAEDAAQEAFLRGWQKLDTYRPEHAFRNWVYAIAVNLTLDALRKESRMTEMEALPPAMASEVEMAVERKDQVERVRKAVMDLPPASRAVLILREYERLSYQEIAAVLKIPAGTVMSRLNYARSRLREALAGLLEA